MRGCSPLSPSACERHLLHLPRVTIGEPNAHRNGYYEATPLFAEVNEVSVNGICCDN